MLCAPYVSSTAQAVRTMLALAELRPSDVVIDLGCGDGRVLFAAALDCGARRAIGYELRDDLCRAAVVEASRLGLSGTVEIRCADLFDADLADGSVVVAYLGTVANETLRPRLEIAARADTRVVTNTFPMAGWLPSSVCVKEVASCDGQVAMDAIYLYRLPLAFRWRQDSLKGE